MQCDGSDDADVRLRMTITQTTFGSLSSILTDHRLSRELKLRTYQLVVRLTLSSSSSSPSSSLLVVLLLLLLRLLLFVLLLLPLLLLLLLLLFVLLLLLLFHTNRDNTCKKNLIVIKHVDIKDFFELDGQSNIVAL